MKINIEGAIVADQKFQYKEKEYRQLIVLTGEGRDVKLMRISIPVDYGKVPLAEIKKIEIPEVEMREFNGKISYRLEK